VKSRPSVDGLALICDGKGLILRVMHDGIGIEGLMPGMPLEALVDQGSRIKLLNFLVLIRSKGVASNWEINFLHEGLVITLRLAGVKMKDRMLVLGARTLQDDLDLCDTLDEIESEYIAQLRSALKEQFESGDSQIGEDSGLFDEISRLNNDLIALQRNLAKKNAELDRMYTEVKIQATTDQLTGVFNRRGFLEIGDRELARTLRFGHPLSAVMFDIDHVKEIND